MPQDALHSSAQHFARGFAVRVPRTASTFPHVVFLEANQSAVVFVTADVSFSQSLPSRSFLLSYPLSSLRITHHVLFIVNYIVTIVNCLLKTFHVSRS